MTLEVKIGCLDITERSKLLLNIRKMACSIVPIAIVLGFVLMPTLADSNYKLAEEQRIANEIQRAKNLEPKTTFELTRATVTVSRSDAREAVNSNYTKYFDSETLAFLMVYGNGWDLQEWACLRKLWTKESNFNSKALNKRSGAYGIAQFMPHTWDNYGFEKTSDAKEQITAGLFYIDERYGSACNAWEHWQRKNWY